MVLGLIVEYYTTVLPSTTNQNEIFFRDKNSKMKTETEKFIKPISRCHDIQHNDTSHNTIEMQHLG